MLAIKSLAVDISNPHYKIFLADYIATQLSFRNRCTYEPFRKEIERTIKLARFQKRRSPENDYQTVRQKVNEGSCTPEEVAEEVYLSIGEIKIILKDIIKTEPFVYEWRPIGKSTGSASGPRVLGLFRKDAPFYDDSRMARVAGIECDEDEDLAL